VIAGGGGGRGRGPIPPLVNAVKLLQPDMKISPPPSDKETSALSSNEKKLSTPSSDKETPALPSDKEIHVHHQQLMKRLL
jgi:hypothetical protein